MEPKSKFGKIPGSVYRDMKLSTRSINELNGRRPGLFITNSREWDVEKIRAICPFAEENILKIKASSTGAPDKLCWMGTKNGEYTTKSGYHAAELEATDKGLLASNRSDDESSCTLDYVGNLDRKKANWCSPNIKLKAIAMAREWQNGQKKISNLTVANRPVAIPPPYTGNILQSDAAWNITTAVAGERVIPRPTSFLFHFLFKLKSMENGIFSTGLGANHGFHFPPRPNKNASSIGDSSSGGLSSLQEPLIQQKHSPENYSVLAAIPPFLFPALGAFLFGYEIGATSCATISIKSPTLSGISWYNLSSVDVGIITSGSLRKGLITAAFLYLVGAIVTALAPVFHVLIIGRVVYGIGVGLTMHAAPMYIAETAPSQIRGRMISLKEFSTVFGMVGGYGIGSLWVTVISGWRYMYATVIPVPIIMAIGMCWLPASPRWLLLRSLQGKGDAESLQDEAIKSLSRLRGSVVVDSAAEQVDEILAELSSVGEDKEATICELFQGKCLKALTIAGGLVLFQQITGQPSVLYYAPSILQTAGFSAATDATRISILLGLLKLAMTGVAVIVIDKLGRRPLLLGGVSGMVLSLFLLGSYYIFYNNVPAVAVAALLLYVGCYQLSFGPISWLMMSEIFPLKLRGRGISIAVLVNFGTNALVTFAFSPLKELLGAGVLFCGFGVICVLSLFFIYFIVPETKGLTLEEIEAKCL
uniref:Major facilitator superfamily (MFS) profile domain-containing protein n=1 Tax=Brassica oleracea TaxID=3712 RepID=A0A3P6B326_BRAOL|nr:unnamed protein product [Brassica oleracea]